ncbi:lytic transglycosylase domain-containing protein [Nitrogeniibacter mangrovi]|uniref:Lytic transglycosylase domain-containing protein n=1 Tax=Nitrogeniibacter mangrovi TaxID=2016596 RepID=A0A6C1B798_9RHOO|nr:lytic transglycosylase domain-containing protein [Nitrogeniibacter mangrovi]QID18695.1 lytic transglycosylase domain-containing protein [Nitrogeniibacter mangrovi]
MRRLALPRTTGRLLLAFLAGAALALPVAAGQQQYEPLSASVRTALQSAVSDRAAPRLTFADESRGEHWLTAMSRRLASRIPDPVYRRDLLVSIQYEATRAGLDPQLVLGLIQVESNFRKYALSRAGARGYMQIMPFWTELLGGAHDNLFHMRTNLRYGCTILRHYLDIEQGNLFRALGRYNGSLGRAEYPNRVLKAWRQWKYTPPPEVSVADLDTPDR